MSKRLANVLDGDLGSPDMNKPVAATPPRVHKLAQRLTAETMQALQDAYRAGASLAELSSGSVWVAAQYSGCFGRQASGADGRI
jgi:hypothetical protein